MSAIRLPSLQRFRRPFGAWGLWCDVSHGLAPVATFRRPNGATASPSRLPSETPFRSGVIRFHGGIAA